MANAIKIFEHDLNYEDGSFVRMKIWKVPQPVPPSDHDLKYSLFYGRRGDRIVGYDNERGKGDHKHILDQEYDYEFIDIETLIADFIKDVEAIRNE
mgnify:CR=1 FL=1